MGRSLHFQVEHHVRDKKNLLFLSCITDIDQYFINFISQVDIHDIYYILKFILNLMISFFIKHIVSN